MRNKFFAVLVLGSLSFSFTALADDVKTARSNDVVEKYVLKSNGVFSRVLSGARGKDLSCAVTSNVSDFKISQHPNDAATAYFIKSGDLHFVKNSKKGARKGNCPPADTGALMGNVKQDGGKYQYGVIPSTKSEYVNWALDGTGTFHAWKNSGLPMKIQNVSDVSTVECFGQSGKAFSKKILLLEKRDGNILAMEDDGDVKSQNIKTSIKHFRVVKDVCKDVGGSGGSSTAQRRGGRGNRGL